MVDLSDARALLLIVGSIVGLLGIFARLYHNKKIAEKDTEIKNKSQKAELLERDISELQARLARISQATSITSNDTGTGSDLKSLSERLSTRLESMANLMGAQAASLYLPIHTDDEIEQFPRGFAFVAAYNIRSGAAEKAMKIRIVENWTILGQCWAKKQPLLENELQKSNRHVVSYDKEIGFVPVHTLISPVLSKQASVGLIQFLNKKAEGSDNDISDKGFGSEESRKLLEILGSPGGCELADQLQQFASHPGWKSHLGLRDEASLENVAIMHLDLTNSSSLFDEVPLPHAAQMINRFNSHVYESLSAYPAVIERFSGDGTMARFHFGSFETAGSSANAAYRAACAATDLMEGFRIFKSTHWKRLTESACERIHLRVTISLGPVCAMNAGPRQAQTPTVIGPAVNRSAKMISYAPRDRNIILIDENVRKAILLEAAEHERALKSFSAWRHGSSASVRSLSGFEYFELDVELLKHEAAAMKKRRNQ